MLILKSIFTNIDILHLDSITSFVVFFSNTLKMKIDLCVLLNKNGTKKAFTVGRPSSKM